jgi:pilus assembly protein CpaB
VDKRKISIVLAVVCALVGLFLLKNWISSTESKFNKTEQQGWCLVAAVDIPTGATIDATMVRPQSVAVKYLQKRAVNSEALVMGKRALVAISAGDQILTTNIASLAARESNATMATQTPAGKRATAVTIPILSAVAGKVRPRDYVDVVGSFPYNIQVDGKTVTEMVTVTLFQNVLVLNIEGNAPAPVERGAKAGPAPSELVVTLALTPKEAAILSFVQDQTRLRLLLRPPLETKQEQVPPVDLNKLWEYVFSNLGQEYNTPKEPEKEPEKPAPPPPPTMEVYRGSEKSNMVIK